MILKNKNKVPVGQLFAGDEVEAMTLMGWRKVKVSVEDGEFIGYSSNGRTGVFIDVDDNGFYMSMVSFNPFTVAKVLVV